MPRIRTIFEILKNQVFYVFIAVVGIGAITGVALLISWKSGEAREKNELRRAFEAGDYGEVYEKSLAALQKKPMDSFFLSTNGFASYQMALSRIDGESAQAYIDQAIWFLRRALLKKPSRAGQICYVLGKAYYAKSADYADLAVKYLEAAKAAGVTALDIDEYLGLAYASLKDYRNSIAAYSRLLGASDTASAPLLIRIAESYMGLEDWDNARAYLTRCLENVRDADVELNARLMLGRVLRNSGDSGGAEAAFNSVLESGENAEAAYELGELYTARGETTRARAAYRRAYRADPAFAPAQARLNTM
ncbi:MAG: tetratricopeptide repeat protein [Treponema sp.]|jgi:tetratricopeptide (TPR) repeat protein|nr:tetratricopeptide repeat protein [Treponema sp.]